MLCVIDPADSMDIEVHNNETFVGHCQFNTKSLFENLGDFSSPCSNNTTFNEGIFVLLPDEMRLEIFAKLIEENDWANLNAASCVNWRWKVEIEELWRKYCEKQDLLQDEQIWARKGKNWKWVCACLTTIVQQENETNGFGSTQKAISVGESKYEGEWKEGKKEGVGRMWWHNGDRYLGDWKQDTKDGFGFMIWANGDNYEGDWKQDLRHGENAKYTYANGGTFVGTYINDERHGEGSYYWPDGDCFKGTWQSGGRKGKGVFISKDGTTTEQEWNESPYVNYSDAIPAKYPTAPSHQSSHPNSG